DVPAVRSGHPRARSLQEDARALCGEGHPPVPVDAAYAAERRTKERAMAKNGFRVMDSDLHTMEPDGLWEKYLEEPFKKFAPRFLRGTAASPNQRVLNARDP